MEDEGEEDEEEEDSDSDDDNVQIHIGEIKTATTPMAYGRAPNYAKMMTLTPGGKAERVGWWHEGGERVKGKAGGRDVEIRYVY